MCTDFEVLVLRDGVVWNANNGNSLNRKNITKSFMNHSRLYEEMNRSK